MSQGARARATTPGTSERGFTLIELMVVIVIVGVLALIAVVGYQKLVGSARTTEATQMVQSIRVAQESFHTETGTYADISTAFCATSTTCTAFYPQSSLGVNTIGSFKTPWGAKCTAGCNTGMDWLQLPVHTQAAVMFGYSTIAGLASSATSLSSVHGVTAPANIGAGAYAIPLSASFPNGVPSDWYLISAVGDVDNDVQPCVVFASSFQSDSVVSAEGN